VSSTLGADFLAGGAAVSTACVAAACSAAALAAYDLSQWQSAVAATLPQSSWSVAQALSGSQSTYTVTLNWVDRQTNASSAAADANSSFGSNAAGTGEKFSYTSSRTFFN
jgi:hypothetical protein